MGHLVIFTWMKGSKTKEYNRDFINFKIDNICPKYAFIKNQKRDKKLM